MFGFTLYASLNKILKVLFLIPIEDLVENIKMMDRGMCVCMVALFTSKYISCIIAIRFDLCDTQSVKS